MSAIGLPPPFSLYLSPHPESGSLNCTKKERVGRLDRILKELREIENVIEN